MLRRGAVVAGRIWDKYDEYVGVQVAGKAIEGEEEQTAGPSSTAAAPTACATPSAAAASPVTPALGSRPLLHARRKLGGSGAFSAPSRLHAPAPKPPPPQQQQAPVQASVSRLSSPGASTVPDASPSAGRSGALVVYLPPCCTSYYTSGCAKH